MFINNFLKNIPERVFFFSGLKFNFFNFIYRFMVYIRLYEEFSVIKDYVLEFVFDGVYRIYGVRPKDDLFLISLKYVYRDNFLEKIDDGRGEEFLVNSTTALDGVVYQSDSLGDVLEELEVLVSMKKYNL